MFEDTKGVIKSYNSKEERQYNGHKKSNEMANNDIQGTTQNIYD
jgi:hypothetical protein